MDDTIDSDEIILKIKYKNQEVFLCLNVNCYILLDILRAFFWDCLVSSTEILQCNKFTKATTTIPFNCDKPKYYDV